MDQHDFEAGLARRLLAWGAVSVAGGAVLAAVGRAAGSPLLRGFGTQTIGWGAIDVGLALGGRARARRLLADPPTDRRARARVAARTRRILIVNAGLDVLYVAGGLAVAAGRGRADAGARGHALAAVAQGAFLLGFDAWHAARVPGAGGDTGRDDRASDLV